MAVQEKHEPREVHIVRYLLRSNDVEYFDKARGARADADAAPACDGGGVSCEQHGVAPQSERGLNAGGESGGAYAVLFHVQGADGA